MCSSSKDALVQAAPGSTVPANTPAYSISRKEIVPPELESQITAAGGEVTPDWARYDIERSALDLQGACEASSFNQENVNFIGRKATIYRHGLHALSSRAFGTRTWRIEFDRQNNWGNNLMGWMSTADPLDQLRNRLFFETAEEAIYFAESNGWEWEVEEDPEQREGDHVDNLYEYRPLPHKTQYALQEAGARKGRHSFRHSSGRQDAWVNLPRTTYGKEPWRKA
jgi:hypothetical protein